MNELQQQSPEQIIFLLFDIMNKFMSILATALAAVSCGQGQPVQTKSQVVEDVIMSRRSIRNYRQVPVARDTMEVILNAGINAPNGQNRQSWEIRVVDNPATLDEFREAMAAANPEMPMARDCFRGAPVMVFIARDNSYDFSMIDCGLLAENMILSAWSMGVGSICLGSPVRFLDGTPEVQANPLVRKVMDKLDFSEGYSLVLCVGFGYPLEEPEAKPRDPSKYRFVD